MSTTRMASAPRFVWSVVLATAASLGLATAEAAPIDGFGLRDFPQLIVDSVLVAYDTTSETLFVDSHSSVFDDDGEGELLSVDGTGFNIILSVDGTGVRGAGTLEIVGTISELGFESGVLLTGEIDDFGFFEGEGTSDEFQFIFTITGGDLADLFGPTGAISVTGTDFPGDFVYDFANDGNGDAFTAPPIPLPGAIWLLSGALLGLGGLARRRHT